jgi:uncharacterized protein (PEP-CTERM system associated)
MRFPEAALAHGRLLQEERLHRIRCGGAFRCATVAAVCFGCLGLAHAESFYFSPRVDAHATWSDNVALQTDDLAKSDMILELVPGFDVRAEGKRLRVVGDFSFDALTYVNGTRGDRVLPSGSLTGRLEAIERFFFVDAGVTSRQGTQDVFGPQPAGTRDFNVTTTTQTYVTPSFEGRLGGDVQYQLRSANSWTHVGGGAVDIGSGYLGEHSLHVGRNAAPLGFGLDVARSETRFESGTVPAGITDSARLSSEYAFSNAFVLGARGGYETTTLVRNNRDKWVYGGYLRWRPAERTDLSGSWEERFFGSSWRLGFRHRMPFLAWNLALSKDVATFPQAFLNLPATNNVAGLLDAAFTTRFPDPVERTRIIQDIISKQGLPSSLATETSLFAQQVSIITSRTGSVTFIGSRNTVALAVFSSHNQTLPDSEFVTPDPALQSVSQQGASVTASHRVSAQTSVSLLTSYARTRTGTRTGTGDEQRSREVAGTLQVTRALSPKSSLNGGVRFSRFESNVAGEPDRTHERAAFVGLGHRF